MHHKNIFTKKTQICLMLEKKKVSSFLLCKMFFASFSCLRKHFVKHHDIYLRWKIWKLEIAVGNLLEENWTSFYFARTRKGEVQSKIQRNVISHQFKAPLTSSNINFTFSYTFLCDEIGAGKEEAEKFIPVVFVYFTHKKELKNFSSFYFLLLNFPLTSMPLEIFCVVLQQQKLKSFFFFLPVCWNLKCFLSLK